MDGWVDLILRLTTFSEFFSETSAEAQQVKADSLAGSSNATKKKPKLPAVSQNEVRQDSSSGKSSVCFLLQERWQSQAQLA